MSEKLKTPITTTDLDENTYEIKYSVKYIPKGYPDDGIKSFKIRKKDLQEKGWKCDSPELHDYIESGFKRLLGFDFDLTLTNIHTFESNVMSSLKGGDLTKKLLEACLENTSLYLFIVTNNYKTTVEKHLKEWDLESCFQTTKSREDFHGKRSGDKESCFKQIYDELSSKRSLDNEGFLNLNLPANEVLIDVVDAVLIDDSTEHIKINLEENKITVIPVDGKENTIQHLEKLNKDYLNGKLNDDIAKYKKTDKRLLTEFFSSTEEAESAKRLKVEPTASGPAPEQVQSEQRQYSTNNTP